MKPYTYLAQCQVMLYAVSITVASIRNWMYQSLIFAPSLYRQIKPNLNVWVLFTCKQRDFTINVRILNQNYWGIMEIVYNIDL